MDEKTKYRKEYYLKNKNKLIEYGKKYYLTRINPAVEIENGVRVAFIACSYHCG